jgi:hypothetical protein
MMAHTSTDTAGACTPEALASLVFGVLVWWSSASTGPRFVLASLHSEDTRKVMSLLHFSRRGGGTTHTKETSLCWDAKTVWVKSIDANPRSQDCVSQRPFGQRVGSGPLKNLLLKTNRTTML